MRPFMKTNNKQCHHHLTDETYCLTDGYIWICNACMPHACHSHTMKFHYEVSHFLNFDSMPWYHRSTDTNCCCFIGIGLRSLDFIRRQPSTKSYGIVHDNFKIRSMCKYEDLCTFTLIVNKIHMCTAQV